MRGNGGTGAAVLGCALIYSCGALVHADTLVPPYGIGDAAIGIATASLPQLLATLGG